MRQLNNKHFDTIEGASARQGEVVSSASSPLVSQQKDENKMKTFLKDITKYTDKTPGESHRAFDCDEITADKIYNAFGATREEGDTNAWVKDSLVIDGGEGVIWMSDYDKAQNRLYVGCEVRCDEAGWFIEINYCKEGIWNEWKEIETPRRKWSRSLSPSLVCQTIIKDIITKAEGGK